MAEYPDPAEGSRVFTEFYDTAEKRLDYSVLSWRVGAGQRPSDEYLTSQGYYGVVRAEVPACDPRTQRALPVPQPLWVVDENAKTVSDAYVVETLSADEQAAAQASATAAVRAQRNALLSASDYTQLPDATVDKAVWAAYRQALRDLMATVDPFNPIWPVPPTE